MVPRLALAGLVVAAALSLGGWATVSASSDSAPGEPLYQVKMARERVAFSFFARSDEEKALRYVWQAEERSKELEKLTRRGASEARLMSVSRKSTGRAPRDGVRGPHENASTAGGEAGDFASIWARIRGAERGRARSGGGPRDGDAGP